MVIRNRCGNIRAPDAPGSGRKAGLVGVLDAEISPRLCLELIVFAPVAQLDRAPGYEPGGREFESLRAHHIINDLG